MTEEKKRTGTINLTPKWRGVLPALLWALEDGTDEGKKIAKEELQRMAEAADLWNDDSFVQVRPLEIQNELTWIRQNYANGSTKEISERLDALIKMFS